MLEEHSVLTETLRNILKRFNLKCGQCYGKKSQKNYLQKYITMQLKYITIQLAD